MPCIGTRSIRASRRRDGGTAPGDRRAGGDRLQRPDGGYRRRARRALPASGRRRASRAVPGGGGGHGESATRQRRGSRVRRARARHRRAVPEAARVAAHLGLLKQLGLVRRAMGDVRGSIEDFTALARYAREHGRGDEEVRALLELGGALSWVDRDRSLAAVEQALALAPHCMTRRCRRMSMVPLGVQRILSRGWRDEDAEACRLSLDTVRRAGERRLQPARWPLCTSAEPPVGVPGSVPHGGARPAAGGGGARRLSLHDRSVPPRVGVAASRAMGGHAARPPRRTRDGGAERPSPVGPGIPLPHGMALHARL